MAWRLRLARALARFVSGRPLHEWAVSVRIDDSPGWSNQSGRYPHDQVDHQQQYYDSLEAWRKNPLAKRIVSLTADYVIGNGITLSSDNPHLQKFIVAFWSHPENNLAVRLVDMCDELTRSGNLFPVLFRNQHDGMSYVRFLTVDQVQEIKTAERDWEKELIVIQKPEQAGDAGRNWYTSAHGRSARAQAVVLHYAVNRPLGAIMGEGDLAPILPWLQRYSRMLEDRVRLHWAARLFLWVVTVPGQKVKEKAQQYATPPESGSVVVKDEAEPWEALTPNLRGADARDDMQATRMMVGVGAGFPPHWFGEAQNVNLSIGQAMQQPAERFLKRRQDYFVYLVRDVLLHAYRRAHALHPDMWPALPQGTDVELVKAAVSDVSTLDNESLARAGSEFTGLLHEMAVQYPGSNWLRRKLLAIAFKFVGEPLEEDDLKKIMSEAGEPFAAVAEPAAAEADDGD